MKIFRTLRFRLAIWNAGAVAITAALTIISVHQSTRWAMTHSLDELLSEDAEEIRLALSDLNFDDQLFKDELDRKAIGHRRHEWFVRLLSNNKKSILESDNAPQNLQFELKPGQDHFGTSDDFRHFTKNIRDDSSIRWIQVGASMESLRQELQRVDAIALTTWLLSLGIAPLLGWILSARALFPLRQMVTSAATLGPNRLSERLPIRHSEDELDQLAHTINSLLDRIAMDVSEKHDFLANAAHELRTPLAAIRATADVALVSQRTGEEYRDLVAQVMEQTDQLSGIVSQLLLLSESSLPPNDHNRKKFSLHDIVSKSVDIFRAVAESHDVKLSIHQNEPIWIYGNREQWIQVLNNLIDNAIKYTPSEGSVTVDLHRVKTDGNGAGVLLSVRDTGIGIQPEDLPHVFDRFFRADRSRTRLTEVSGTGLGLSICQAVVEQHYGTILCESKPGTGTTLTVHLPESVVAAHAH